MPLSQLDPNADLIVVDMQKGIVGLPLVDPIAPVIQRTQELLAAFRNRNLPVVLVNVVCGALAKRSNHTAAVRSLRTGRN